MAQPAVASLEVESVDVIRLVLQFLKVITRTCPRLSSPRSSSHHRLGLRQPPHTLERILSSLPSPPLVVVARVVACAKVLAACNYKESS